MIEALELAASRSSAWQDARRALEGDLNKSEKRARQAQEKLDAKQKEVVNLLEALKTAESKSSGSAGKGDGKSRCQCCLQGRAPECLKCCTGCGQGAQVGRC